MPVDEVVLEAVLKRVLDERSRIDMATHLEHHSVIQDWIDSGVADFIRVWVEREKLLMAHKRARDELIQAVLQKFLGWGVVAAVSALGLWLMKLLGVHYDF